MMAKNSATVCLKLILTKFRGKNYKKGKFSFHCWRWSHQDWRPCLHNWGLPSLISLSVLCVSCRPSAMCLWPRSVMWTGQWLQLKRPLKRESGARWTQGTEEDSSTGQIYMTLECQKTSSIFFFLALWPISLYGKVSISIAWTALISLF